MNIVKISGGLGNQMFQYAFAVVMQNKNKSTVKLDISSYERDRLRSFELQDIFHLGLGISNKHETNEVIGKKIIFEKIEKKIFKKNYIFKNRNIIKELSFSYDDKVLEYRDNFYFDGYWQSYKYFKEYESIIYEIFSFKNNLDEINKKNISDMKKENSVSIHIRRGDYISNPKAKTIYGGICDTEYYKNAISYINNAIDNPIFYVFSDDSNWVKENIDFGDNCRFIDWNVGIESYKDMQLMSNCKHNIIANSSFSWWGAWLNKNRNKIVIAPSRWFATFEAPDLIPEMWIRI